MTLLATLILCFAIFLIFTIRVTTLKKRRRFKRYIHMLITRLIKKGVPFILKDKDT